MPLQFEKNILEICCRLNATENIRGINFRFVKNGLDVTPYRIQSLSGLKASYVSAVAVDVMDRSSANCFVYRPLTLSLTTGSMP